MNGPQDLGGAQGFGPLPLEDDEPLFHAEWERRVMALTLAMGATGAWNIDMSRSARERLSPARYLAASYYEIWFEGLLKLLQERGLVDASELATESATELAGEPPRDTVGGDSGKIIGSLPGAGLPPGLRRLTADRVPAALAAGSPTARPGSAPRFATGDRVRARNLNPSGHTRLPRYIRGRVGVIERHHGAHVFPDRHAHEGTEAPEPLYTVRFDAPALWGPDTTADSVRVDCWESYLELDPAASSGLESRSGSKSKSGSVSKSVKSR